MIVKPLLVCPAMLNVGTFCTILGNCIYRSNILKLHNYDTLVVYQHIGYVTYHKGS